MRGVFNVVSLLRATLCIPFFILVGCQPERRTFVERVTLSTNTESGVSVILALDSDEFGEWALRAVFIPDEPGYRLCGQEMRFDGLYRLGVPTRLEITGNAMSAPAGSSLCDARSSRVLITKRDVALPLFPEGPVTIRAPLRFKAKSGDIYVQALLSYMVFNPKDGDYYPPVRHKPILFKVPKELPLAHP